ncbi:MAG: helix-turn-helix domain-containing protein [Clostridia bacterium]|nr:helix-turn-helix domain-containing protein [Clostridia bacterium]
MAQNKYSTKERKFQHLTIEKRAQIEILLRTKMPKSQIARMVGIARSTLYNELARGSVVQMDSELRQYTRYFSDVGQRVYKEHRESSRPPLKLIQAHEMRFYKRMRMFSLEDGRKQLARYQRLSNNIIMTFLGMKSPNQVLALYHGIM